MNDEAANGAPGATMREVAVWQVTIKLQSGAICLLTSPVDMTDADALDLIMEIAKNLPAANREKLGILRKGPQLAIARQMPGRA